jgi:hypothetical protein
MQPLPVSVDRLRPRDASALNGAVRRRPFIRMLSSGDSQLLTTYQYRQALRPPVLERFNRFNNLPTRYCRRATATNLPAFPSLAADWRQLTTCLRVPPGLAAPGFQEICPVLTACAVNKRQPVLYLLLLLVPPSLAATGSQEISPVLRALYPSRGCVNGHQAG